MKTKGSHPIKFVNPIKQVQCSFKTFTGTKKLQTDLGHGNIAKLEMNQKVRVKKKSQYV
jgi:hypothetical protein